MMRGSAALMPGRGRREARRRLFAQRHPRRRWPAWLGLAVVLVSVALAFSFHRYKQAYAAAKEAAVFPVQQGPATVDVAPVPKAGMRVVVFGDSRVWQWRDFPVPAGAELVMKGVPGETTAQMRLRFDADVLAQDPDVVVLQLGINDLVAIGVLPQRREEIVRQCDENVRHFVEALRARNARTILLTVIPPGEPPWWRRPFWRDAIAVETEQMNRRWLALPASPLLRVVDTRNLLMDAGGRWHEGVTADTLHLTPAGYARLNAAIGPLVGGAAR
jgi:lysophospholipase L1-like esterase